MLPCPRADPHAANGAVQVGGADTTPEAFIAQFVATGKYYWLHNQIQAHWALTKQAKIIFHSGIYTVQCCIGPLAETYDELSTNVLRDGRIRTARTVA